MIFGLGKIFDALLKPNPAVMLSEQLGTLIQNGTGKQITDFLSAQTDETRQSFSKQSQGFLRQAMDRGDTDILDVVVAEYANNNFNTILYTHAHSPMGSVCTGKYDLLGYAMAFGTDEMTFHVLSKPSVSPSTGHFAYAQENGKAELAEALIQKGIRAEVVGKDFKLVRI